MRSPSHNVGSTTSVIIRGPLRHPQTLSLLLSSNTVPSSLTLHPSFSSLLLLMYLRCEQSQHLKLNLIVCTATGIDIVSLTLPMLPAAAAAKAAAPDNDDNVQRGVGNSANAAPP